jgi:pyruvate dehydrogenase E2 component (dihydrolipoamide acetyltransferase)
MSKTIDIVVPDLGDFSDVEIIEVLVEAGSSVDREDGLITLETDKASIDVPSPEAGIVESLSVNVGDTVSTGDVIGKLTLEVSDTVVITPALDDSSDEAPAAEAQDEPAAEAAAEPAAATAEPAGEQTLVVPAVGDFHDVEVIEVHIEPGQEVEIDDPLITLETDKAAMDVPATHAGKISKVLVSVADKLNEGSPIATIDAVASAAPSEPQAPPKAPPTAETRMAEPVRQETKAAEKPAAKAELAAINEAGFARAHASPSVRKFARELGVDLGRVEGTGPKKRVVHDDVKAFVKAVMTGGAAAGGGAALPEVPRVDFSKFGDIESKPLTRIQKISGPRLQASWINLPHVTQHDLADITELEQRRQKLKGPAKERGIGLTPLAFVMKACVAALQEFPNVNSSLSDDGKSLVHKKYCHLGFAADTEQGLMVPVIRDADQKDVYEIAKELGELSALAREGKLKADQLQGATFTISSLGGIGGTAFTPIVNAPEVAILGVSRSSMQPVWNGSEFVPRLMLPLSFSYDHRVIDGAQAVRFTTYLGEQMADVDGLLQAIP